MTNEEVGRYLNIHAGEVQTTHPNRPGYVQPSEAALRYASNEWLSRRIDHAGEPLVTAAEKGHVLSGENLEADVDDFSSWLQADLRDVQKAMRDPEIARKAIRADYEKSGGRPPSYTEGSKLTVEEVYEYIEILKGLHPSDNRLEQDLHEASLDAVSSMINHWKKRQFPDPETEPDDSQVFADLNARPGSADAPSLYVHLTSERGRTAERFHKLNEETIRHLGEAAANAAAVRRAIGGQPGPEPSAPAAEPSGSAPETARQPTPERKSLSELFDTVLTLTQGRTQANVDVTGGFRHVGDAPPGGERVVQIPREIIQDLERDPDWRKHPNEAVAFSEVGSLEPVMGADGKPVMARNAETSRDEPQMRWEPATIRNEETGEDEPMVRFRYRFQYSDRALSDGLNKGLPRYQEWQGGRNGQHVWVGVELPQSVANQLQQEVQSRPRYARL